MHENSLGAKGGAVAAGEGSRKKIKENLPSLHRHVWAQREMGKANKEPCLTSINLLPEDQKAGFIDVMQGQHKKNRDHIACLWHACCLIALLALSRQQFAQNSRSVTFVYYSTQTSSIANGGAGGRFGSGLVKEARAGLGPGASDHRHQDADVG